MVDSIIPNLLCQDESLHANLLEADTGNNGEMTDKLAGVPKKKSMSVCLTFRAKLAVF